MSTAGLIFAPDSPNCTRNRSIEHSYQVAMIAGNPDHLREFIVASQAMQTQALLDANTQLAEVNRGIAGIHQGIGELTEAVGRGFEDPSNAMNEGFDQLSGRMQQGFGLMTAEMQRQNAVMVEIARLLSTKLEGEAREIRNSALSAVREGCSPEAFDQDGSLREALLLFRTTVEHPMGVRDYVAWFNIGWLLWKLDGDLPQAEKAFATAVRQSMEKKDAYHVMAARHLGYMRYLQRNTDGASQGVRLALQCAPDDPENVFTALLVAAQAGDAGQVVQIFRGLITSHPDRLAPCLAEAELGRYTTQLQPVVQALVGAARTQVRAAVDRITGCLREERELAASIGQQSLLAPETQKTVTQTMERVRKMDTASADWPTTHALLAAISPVVKRIAADVEAIRPKVSVLASIRWAAVPAGPFLYGANEERRSPHAFRIMQTPVTVAMYRTYCSAADVAMPSAPSWGWRDDHPMVNVSWDDAQAFCRWSGLALPTEEQWEKAARGTDGREYPWGNGWDPRRCVCSVSPIKAESTAPVGSIPAGASPYGCMDTAGNVWEWCADWYDSTRTARVLRGGAWRNLNADYFCVHYRYRNYPDNRIGNRGFRCVSPEGSS
jgi:hypothetical protein